MKTEWKLMELFGGIGGGDLGMSGARGEYGGHVGQFRTLCSIDADPVVCRNFERITGHKAVCTDLFSIDQYRDFHGKEPPEGWREATPADILEAAGGEYPDVVFTSPPCKGFSGLLPEKSAKTKKYQALNLLTIRGIKLCLEAFADDLPALFLLENVPRITTRGKPILERIKAELVRAGYAVNDESHDCGEIGGLGQHRKRYLLIARNKSKMNSFVYRPPVRKLKTIGDVIGPLPLPGDVAACGRHHKLPNLEWKTWVRLALIPAGGDWRDLNKVDWEQYRIVHEPRGGAYAVEDWNETARTVTGTAGPGRSNGAAAISDPRTSFGDGTHTAIYQVSRWNEAGPTVTGAHRPNNGAVTIPDPRLQEREGRHPGVYRVVRVDEPAPCVTGTRFGSGAIAVGDPRFIGPDKYNHTYRVMNWQDTGGTVTSGGGPSNGGHIVADPRLADRPGRYTDQFRMQSWENPAATVTGTTDVQAGAQLVTDPRIGCSPRSGTMGVQRWDEPGSTVTGSGDIHSGASAIADPRIPADTDRGVYIIIAPDGTVHRPLTTFELAMLQSFPMYLIDGSPFELVDCSDAKAREYIGNAVPPDAAKAIGTVMLVALMASYAGDFMMSWDEIWVKPQDERQPATLVH